MAFAGGFTFNGPVPSVTSGNITPDPSRIPYYDENLFLQVVRTGKAQARDLGAVMPIVAHRNMTDEDLKAICAYLLTIPAVHQGVYNSLRPTASKLCRGKHGAGDQN